MDTSYKNLASEAASKHTAEWAGKEVTLTDGDAWHEEVINLLRAIEENTRKA